MSVIADAINNASRRKSPRSKSLAAWLGLSKSDRDVVTSAILDGSLGLEGMSRVLKENGHPISRHFLSKVARDEELS